MTTNGNIDIGDEIACFDTDSPLVALMSSCVVSTSEPHKDETKEPAQRPNSALKKIVCHCGKEHFTLSAALPCGAHQQVLLSAQDLEQIVSTELTQSVQFDYLLVQTDGSFLTKSDHTAGGAGLVIWGANYHRLPQPLFFLAQPLPEATDSMHAEALGLSAAASLLAEHLTGLQSSLKHRIEIVFQMDNLPIIQHINGLAKCSH
jgi:hypothetical protein